MGIFTNLRTRAAQWLAPNHGALSSPLYMPHEPFAGAWQQNAGDCQKNPSVLSYSPVYSCINIISQDVSRLPARVKTQLPDGSIVVAENHPINAVLLRPNHYQSPVEFWQRYMASKLTAGNTYVFIRRDARGVASAFYVIDPRTVQTLITESGDVFYRIGHCEMAGLYDVTLPASEIIHDRAVTLFHDLVGVSPLYAAAVSALGGLAINQNSTAFFQNEARPSGVLSVGAISEESADRLKAKWKEEFTKGGHGRIAVLKGEAKWQPLAMTAEEAQLIDQLKWVQSDIAQVYRVPLYKLGDLTKVTFRNAETLGREYLNACLVHYLEAIESRWDVSLNFPRNTWLEFDTSGMLRMETDLRMTAYQTGLQAGVFSINEVRLMEGLPPVEGGNEPMIQMQYQPVSKVAAGVPPSATATAPAGGVGAEPADAPAGDDTADAANDDGDSVELAFLAAARATLTGVHDAA